MNLKRSFLQLCAATALVATATPAMAEWKVVTSERFEMYSQEKEKDIVDFVARLERFDMILAYYSGVNQQRPGKRLKVYWVRNANQVQEIVRAIGSGIQGYYVSATPYGAIAVVPGETKSVGSRQAGARKQEGIDPEQVIFHEYGHHFMLQNFPVAFPGWFVEGFAEYYGYTKFEPNGNVVLGNYADVRTGEINYFGMAKLDKLLDPKARGRIGSFYGTSWLLTHYLNFDPERRKQLTAYLADVQSGMGSVEAGNKNFSGGLAQLQKDLEKYWRRRIFSFQTLGNIRDYDRAKIKVAPVADDQASAMIQAIRFYSGGAEDKIERQRLRSFLTDAVKSQPQSTYLKAFLADIYYENDEDDLAIATAAEALAIDPAHHRARLVKAVALMEKAQTLEGADTKRKQLTVAEAKVTPPDPDGTIVVTASRNAQSRSLWAEALKLISAANRADPDDPYPLYLYYEYLRRRGEPLTEVAVDGLTKAHVTSPQYTPFRFALAAAFSVEGDNKTAASLVKAEAFSPHGGEDRRIARALLKRYECLMADSSAACDFKVLTAEQEEKEEEAEKDKPA
jgi:tetratricopeptide (TPR) repeat protein